MRKRFAQKIDLREGWVIYLRVPAFNLDGFKRAVAQAADELELSVEAYVYDGYMYNCYVVASSREDAERIFSALDEKAKQGEFYYTVYEIRKEIVDTYGKKRIL